AGAVGAARARAGAWAWERARWGAQPRTRTPATPAPPPAEAEAVLDAELARLARTPPTAGEMQRAPRSVATKPYRAVGRLNGNASRADLLSAFEMWRGDPRFIHGPGAPPPARNASAPPP